MRVLITGSNGFIAKNLYQRLAHMDNVEPLLFSRGDNFGDFESFAAEIDLIFHLAGVNRPDDPQEFYADNADLTESLVTFVRDNELRVPIVFSSSTQAAFDNDYGKSKRLAEDALREIGEDYPVYIYRLNNVFGKWCKPNYNSVVATFCHNIINDLPITISDRDNVLNLVYVDDVIDEFISIMNGNKPTHKDDEEFYCVHPCYTLTLGELADTLYDFRDMLTSIHVPSTGDIFTKKLFSTFVSYGTQKDFVTLPKVNADARGTFTELIKNSAMGQVSVSTSVRGVTRGNHFHDTKMERFIVLKGSARITFRHIVTSEVMTFDVGEEQHEIVTIPVGYTHNIENTGDELILLLWGNEEFDPGKPDTFFEEV